MFSFSCFYKAHHWRGEKLYYSACDFSIDFHLEFDNANITGRTLLNQHICNKLTVK